MYVRCNITLYILAIAIVLTNCFTAKHSKYKNFVIEDNRLCSVVANRKIELKKDREEALIVSQSTTKDHTADWSKNFNCKFYVASDNGLFAVIQSMNFRKNSTTGECIDYVQFGNRRPKICENFNIATDYYENANIFGSSGFIETTILISKDSWKLDSKMELKIVYTKYKSCNSNSMYSSCFLTSQECIHNDLFNDSLVNCPVEDCTDETNCAFLRQRLHLESCAPDKCSTHITNEQGTNSTKVILSAVTSLVVSFAVFIICIWVCKKTGKVCWSARCSETTRTRQPSRVIEMQNRTETSVQAVPPEAPAAPDPEKDLPPSYDSLFPS